MSLRNEGTSPISAQIRVFRWSLVDGKEKLEPTDDVVASPPSITLTPNGQYVTRIVRVSKQPVTGEESYRLLVDQLPDLSQQKNGTVNLLMRYSIPVFFGASNKKNPTVAWSYAIKGDKITLTARNDGERRLRISALTVRDAGGKTVSFGAGLAGLRARPLDNKLDRAQPRLLRQRKCLYRCPKRRGTDSSRRGCEPLEHFQAHSDGRSESRSRLPRKRQAGRYLLQAVSSARRDESRAERAGPDHGDSDDFGRGRHPAGVP